MIWHKQPEMVERVAQAIAAVEDLPYSIRLVRLVDGFSTYRLSFEDGSSPIEFDGIDAAHEHLANVRADRRARVAIEAMRDYTETMSQAGGAVAQFWMIPAGPDNLPIGQSAAERCWHAMIDGALGGSQ